MKKNKIRKEKKNNQDKFLVNSLYCWETCLNLSIITKDLLLNRDLYVVEQNTSRLGELQCIRAQ